MILYSYMAEAPTGGDSGPPETQPVVNLEILDFQNHGAVYGRFLLASQFDQSDAQDIINPVSELRFTEMDIRPLDQRNHNPTFERFSFAEREAQWQGKSYDDAYSEWRTQFTDAIKNIKDEKRIGAFQTILPGKSPADFTPNDADDFFEIFSKDKSDVTEFVGLITRKLGSEGKIDPTYLKILLPHFEWLASGLFGKNTASMVTRLIELESELHNNPDSVISAFTANKDRINTPLDHERRLLGVLHAANLATVQQPKVTSEALEEEDEEELAPPPLSKDQPQAPTPKPAPNPVSPAPRAQAGVKDEPPIQEAEELGTHEIIPLKADLNTSLESETRNKISYKVQPKILMDYLISSFGEDFKIQVGEPEITGDGITIRQVKVSKLGGSVTINNIAISNNPNIPGELLAKHGKINISILAKAMYSERDIRQKFSAINSIFRDELQKSLERSNSSWVPKSLSISNGMITVGFEKTS